ncbi:MAG: eCIS core domain-containing protein, partial [Burkholderiales bacterium]
MSIPAPLQTRTAKSKPSGSSAHAGPLAQRDSVFASQRSSLTSEGAHGNSKRNLQAKLAIGATNDPLEQEADRIADQVLAAPANPTVTSAPPRIQRFTRQSSGQADTAPASVDRALASPGTPLDPGLQQDMEQRFGRDFSRVRVHSGTAAEQSAREVNANAYTAGHNIVFGAGRFVPGTHDGRRLIAHELAHVVQQTGLNGLRVRRRDEVHGLSHLSTSTDRALLATVQRQYSSSSAKVSDPNAVIPVEDFIKYVEAVERTYASDSPDQILTRIRQQYYSGLAFDALGAALLRLGDSA